jgi:DNA-binding protein YbaB
MTQPKSADYAKLAHQAFAIRDEFAAAASKLEEAEVTSTSGGVTVTLTPNGQMRAIKIDPRLADDVAALERDVLYAHQAAATAIRQMAENMLSPLRDLVDQATQASGPRAAAHTHTHAHHEHAPSSLMRGLGG